VAAEFADHAPPERAVGQFREPCALNAEVTRRDRGVRFRSRDRTVQSRGRFEALVALGREFQGGRPDREEVGHDFTTLPGYIIRPVEFYES
jgi:hypothetical protein